MDPLRPFSELIRALRKSGAAPPERAQAPVAPRQSSPEQGGHATAAADAGLVALQSEIRSRLRRTGLADPLLAREAFVEAVMASQLGLGSTHSPELAEVARSVAARIGSHARLSERLHAILTALAEGRPTE